MTLSELLKIIRQYFWGQNFTEVEIPYLNPSLPLEPNLYAFTTTWAHQNQTYYLPTSPELALKKFLAENKKNCFAVSHCFRDLESAGPHHHPEFLMLEWYEINNNYLDLMTSVEKFLTQFSFPTPFPRFTLPKILPQNEPDFNQFFLNEIEPSLPPGPVFVTGYPAFLTPLSASENGFAARFELYISKVEIANGCSENRSKEQISSAFAAQNLYRLQNHLPTHPYSPDIIDHLSQIPPSAGVGLGLERLLMILNHQDRLK